MSWNLNEIGYKNNGSIYLSDSNIHGMSCYYCPLHLSRFTVRHSRKWSTKIWKYSVQREKSAFKKSVKTEHRAGGDTRATIIIEVSATRLGYSSNGRAQTQHAWGPEFKPQRSGRALRKIQDFALGNEKGDLRTRHKEGTSQSSRMEQCKLIWKPFIFSTKRASGCHAWVRLMMEVFPQVPPQKNTESTAVMI